MADSFLLIKLLAQICLSQNGKKLKYYAFIMYSKIIFLLAGNIIKNGQIQSKKLLLFLSKRFYAKKWSMTI